MKPTTNPPPTRERERTRIAEVTVAFDPAMILEADRAGVASAFEAIMRAVPGFAHARIVARFTAGQFIPIIRQVGGGAACPVCSQFLADVVTQAKRMAAMGRAMTRPGGCVTPDPIPEPEAT